MQNKNTRKNRDELPFINKAEPDTEQLFDEALSDKELAEREGEEEADNENIRRTAKVYTEYDDGLKQEVNSDWTLAETNLNLEEWASKQFLITQRINEYFLSAGAYETAEKAKKLLMQDINIKLIFTRSREGKVLKAHLGSKTPKKTGTAEAIKKLFGKKEEEETE